VSLINAEHKFKTYREVTHTIEVECEVSNNILWTTIKAYFTNKKLKLDVTFGLRKLLNPMNR
jgi:hypothetical protein